MSETGLNSRVKMIEEQLVVRVRNKWAKKNAIITPLIQHVESIH